MTAHLQKGFRPDSPQQFGGANVSFVTYCGVTPSSFDSIFNTPLAVGYESLCLECERQWFDERQRLEEWMEKKAVQYGVQRLDGTYGTT